MAHVSFLVVLVVVTALAFDFTNGFHDTANAMATSIATGALSPRTAVLISGVLNLVGAFLSTEVARTVSGGIVDDALVTPGVIFAGLVGAILWNLTTWLLGLPSSSSHALFGGLIGAVCVGVGTGGVHFVTVVQKVLLPALLSPLIAGAAALPATYLAYRLTSGGRRDRPQAAGSAGTARPGPADAAVPERGFRVGQVFSASLVSLAHGTNDAQKTMGIITLTLISAGALDSSAGPPLWVVATAGLAISLGTYLGGWRIIRTMGRGITDIHPPQGFAAETAATAVILSSAHFGFPLSTTQVCSGGILGAGLGRRLAEVRWGTAGRVAVGWALTLPAAAAVGALAALLVVHGGTAGIAVTALAALALSTVIVLAARRAPVDASNVNDGHTVAVRPAPASA
ncbi:inorganic phosphate transporter [Kitasatospora fiedleri]|uniref:inorganic phosphate transporter n=1 Tax=Kitasatospora fiedleri TaxID=2991545 RepID=UPI00249AB8F1|nr:inorganic phosphate transporter [Kitasatospora fiedleri]